MIEPTTTLLRRLAAGLAILLALLVPAAVQTQPSPGNLAHQVAPNDGDPLFVTWTMGWEAHALIHHPTSVLAGNIFYPRRDAVAWSDNLLVAAPVYGLFDWLGGGRVLLAYNLVTLLGFLGVGLAVYALAKEVIGDRGPALIGATVFSLSAARSESVGHTQLCGFAFVVLAVLALIRFLDRRRWTAAVAFGLASAATWLMTAYYAVLLMLVVVPFLAVWLAQRRFRAGRRFWVGLAGAAAIALLIVAPTLPAYLGLQGSGQFSRDTRTIAGAHLSDFWRLPPSLFYRTVFRVGATPNYGRGDFYPGLVLIGLVVVAALGLRRGRGRRFAGDTRRQGADHVGGAEPARPSLGWPLAAGALPCAALIVGPNAPGWLAAGYDGLRTVVPGVSSLRDLDRFWVWPLLCLSLAAAAGTRRLLGRLRRRARPTAIGILVALAWLELLFRPPLSTVDLGATAVAANRALQQLPSGPVLELPEPIGPSFAYVTAGREVRSLIDRDPRVDGYSGNLPPETFRVVVFASRATVPELVPVMRAYGVRYLVLHESPKPCAASFDAGEIAAITASLNGVSGIIGMVPAGSDVVVELAPGRIDRRVPTGPPGAPRRGRCA
jgi:hypothetical protein